MCVRSFRCSRPPSRSAPRVAAKRAKGASQSPVPAEASGAVKTKSRQILNADKSIAYSDYPDAITLHPVDGKIAMVSHTEFPSPGGLWVTSVDRVAASGELKVTRTSRLDTAGVNGLGAVTGGSVFGANGNLHLGAESLAPDCRSKTAVLASNDTARFYGYYTGDAVKSLPNPPNKGDYGNVNNSAIVAKAYSCYNMGSIVQVEPYKSNGEVDGRVTKLRTMGRFSHETAVVAPDRKTVMLTADDKMGVFAMFVPDKPGNLYSGELFAAKSSSPPSPRINVTLAATPEG